jgi:hypothetical protein
MRERLEIDIEQHKGTLVLNGAEVCLLEGIVVSFIEKYFNKL